ncbi:MAG: class C sortase [Clostridiales bacterium]|nr:class C sortase [Clostridiales bacterium]
MTRHKILYNTVIVLTCIVFIIGLSMLLYPLFGNIWNEHRHAKLISGYTEEISRNAEKEDYSEIFRAAYEYNENLVGGKVPDVFAFPTVEDDENYMKCLSFRDDGIMGYISIPRIDLNLPVYHTTSREVLEKGVGHLQGSSLPVGGESTHCVLSAHRGLPSAALFTDLNLLDMGDRFYIHILDEILAYEIDQILIVEPTQTESLAVFEGEDYVTLMTCTPYGINTHRLLVRGHRVEYDPEILAEDESGESLSSLHTRYGLWAGGGLLITIIFIAVMYILLRKPLAVRRVIKRIISIKHKT